MECRWPKACARAINMCAVGRMKSDAAQNTGIREWGGGCWGWRRIVGGRWWWSGVDNGG